ncbi:MAG: signal peptidase I [Firmicutes bacterium]|nr:signal peptidase I [Bacillota bacterium]
MKNLGYYTVRTFSLILTICLVLVCLFFGYLYYCSIAHMEVPKLGPFRVYMVLSPSMTPVFNMDDAVIICNTNTDKLEPGDIICFTAFENNAVITHRITNKEITAHGYEFRTKGDNVSDEDVFVTPQDRIIGKYIMRIPKLQTFLDLTKQKPYILVGLVVLILLIQFLCGVAERKFKPVIADNIQVEAVSANEDSTQLTAEQQQLLIEQQQAVIEQQRAMLEQQMAMAQQVQNVDTESWNKEKGSTSHETDKD